MRYHHDDYDDQHLQFQHPWCHLLLFTHELSYKDCQILFHQKTSSPPPPLFFSSFTSSSSISSNIQSVSDFPSYFRVSVPIIGSIRKEYDGMCLPHRHPPSVLLMCLFLSQITFSFLLASDMQLRLYFLWGCKVTRIK